MFINFFYSLKRHGVPVSTHEWIALHEAMEKNLHDCSLNRFYYIARSVLVKNEVFFDKYDLAFLDTFKDIETMDEVMEKILDGMRKTKALQLTEEEKLKIQELSLSKVLENFEKQLREGNYKNHVGGNEHIGTGGRSTQGAFGYNPAGVRIGQGESRHHRAIQIAEKRKFQNYSGNVTLDTRQMKVALSHLRTLLPIGPEEKLNLDGTIDATCRNAGDLEFVWENKDKKAAKLLLMMDVGGSMTPYSVMVDRLFSAARSQLSRFKHLYFHNCVYQFLSTDIEREKNISTADFLRFEDPEYKLIIVGDAEMNQSELIYVNGAIDYWLQNDIPGVIWLEKVRAKFKNSIWLNPIPRKYWDSIRSLNIVKGIFPMFELTLDGLDEGVRFLMKGKGKFYN